MKEIKRFYGNHKIPKNSKLIEYTELTVDDKHGNEKQVECFVYEVDIEERNKE